MPPVVDTVTDDYAHLTDLLPTPLRNLSHGLNIPNLLIRNKPSGQRANANHAQLSMFERQVVIKIVTDSDEQRLSAAHQDMGQKLARQDRWDHLAALIKQKDKAREITVSGLALADLLVHGARADMVQAAEHALLHGDLDPQADFDESLDAFEETLASETDDYGIALVLAHTHIDIGWAWRGNSGLDSLSETNLRGFYKHFDRAGQILDVHTNQAAQSPALLSARCALLPGQSGAASLVTRDFEALIDLDPENQRSFRTLGNYLLPRWFGNYEQLDLEARRIAARTFHTWGAGGYTWVYFDALLTDAMTMNMLDMEYFTDGIKDILSRRTDQQTVNLMAAHAHAAEQLAREFGRRDMVDPGLADQFRATFHEIIDTHLREIHPLIWGHAEIGFDNAARSISLGRLMQKGREAALLAIAERHYDTLSRGEMVIFQRDGVNIHAL